MPKAYFKYILLGCVVILLAGCASAKQENDAVSKNVVARQVHQNLSEAGKNKEKQSEKSALPEKRPALQESGQEQNRQGQESQRQTDHEAQMLTEAPQEDKSKTLQIVFLGDDVFDDDEKAINKIPELTALQCNAQVSNLAITGTSASLFESESAAYEEWTSKSLAGVVNVMSGLIPVDIFDGTRVEDVIETEQIDFSQTDYFVVGYGLNDFLRGTPRSNSEKYYDLTTYLGACRYAVDTLRSMAPDATIILCAPAYVRFFEDGFMTGDGNSVNKGNGTLFDYKGTCEYLAGEKQTIFLDAYEELGIDGYTAEKYLEDGIHLNAEGRQLYADKLSQIIKKYEATKNN